MKLNRGSDYTGSLPPFPTHNTQPGRASPASHCPCNQFEAVGLNGGDSVKAAVTRELLAQAGAAEGRAAWPPRVAPRLTVVSSPPHSRPILNYQRMYYVFMQMLSSGPAWLAIILLVTTGLLPDVLRKVLCRQLRPSATERAQVPARVAPPPRGSGGAVIVGGQRKGPGWEG